MNCKTCKQPSSLSPLSLSRAYQSTPSLSNRIAAWPLLTFTLCSSFWYVAWMKWCSISAASTHAVANTWEPRQTHIWLFALWLFVTSDYTSFTDRIVQLSSSCLPWPACARCFYTVTRSMFSWKKTLWAAGHGSIVSNHPEQTWAGVRWSLAPHVQVSCVFTLFKDQRSQVTELCQMSLLCPWKRQRRSSERKKPD